ncbi:MAG TPA: tetratricopeptide repeat protein [Hyphomicrobiaceae bacterium]|jgi:Flp pilus assembly protein TadD|nr:tetratricopeptide repeat protein [Hyphomicrobiaceae bacterium]
MFRSGYVGRAMAVAACLALGACAQQGGEIASLSDETAAAADLPGPGPGATPAKAAEYWGKAFAKNPRDSKIALNYARSLKAIGEKQRALAVLQEASIFHGTDRAINGEYGRLALDLDQISVAQKLLEAADDPTHPDWKIVSARGTALAKEGRYQDAIKFYERAIVLAPDQPSVLNNLALAYAMVGNADKAEPLLKRAAAVGGHDPRVSQNLALVLSLQGKYDEAKIAAARDATPEVAAANVDYVRKMVKLDPKPMPKMAPAPALAPKAVAQHEPTPPAKAPEGHVPAASWGAQVAIANTPW